MLLSTSPCRPQLLPMLLECALDAKEADRLEAHLAYCYECRTQLESLAGDPFWWQTTENALRDFDTNSKDVNSSLCVGRSESESLCDAPRLESSWLSKIVSDGSLGQYQLEHTIGHGGTGVVVMATDTVLLRRVAIKVLYPHLAANGSARQRFAREAQAAAAVVHPSIVPIHAVDASHDPPYLVMAYVPGGSLQQRLDQNGPLTIVEILRIGHQIADGLAAAHRTGLVHRDVKPANILLEAGTDRVMLGDFGLARALDDASLTASGFIAGTPPYMSPEQARGETIDSRSDLFSVGSLLFAMATGRPPFSGASALNIMQNVAEKATPRVNSINESISPWFNQLIQVCHSKNPQHRVASAEDLAELLRQCLAHVQRPDAYPLPRALKTTKATRIVRRIGLGLCICAGIAMVSVAMVSEFATSTIRQSTGAKDNVPNHTSSTFSQMETSGSFDSANFDSANLDQQLRSVDSALNSLQQSFQGDWQ